MCEYKWKVVFEFVSVALSLCVGVCICVHVCMSESLAVLDPGTAYTNRPQLSAFFVMALYSLIV